MARLPTVASLFDSGLRVFAKEWKHLASAVVLLSLPLYLLSLGLESNPRLFIPYILLSLIIGPLLSIITTSITYMRYENNKTIHSQGLYKFIHDKFFPVLWTSIISGIVVLLSLVLLIIPVAILGIIYLIAQPVLVIGSTLSVFGMISLIVLIICTIIITIGASVYLMFAIPITVLENKFGLVAINESIDYVKGRWWNIFGRVVVLYLIGFFFTMIIAVFSGMIVGYEGLGNLISTLLQQVVFLPISLSLIIFYLDIRGKKSQASRTVSVTKPAKKKVVAKKTSTKTSAKKKTAKKSKVTKKSSTKKSSTKRSTKKSSKKVAKKKAPVKKKAPKKKTVKKTRSNKVTSAQKSKISREVTKKSAKKKASAKKKTTKKKTAKRATKKR